jgi:hypothetical protein
MSLDSLFQSVSKIHLKPSLVVCILTILFNPIYWNLVARLEYRHRTLGKVFGKKRACYGFAASVFLLGLFRDYCFGMVLPIARPVILHYIITSQRYTKTLGNQRPTPRPRPLPNPSNPRNDCFIIYPPHNRFCTSHI